MATPDADFPGDETPGDDTPGDETPGDETPGDDGDEAARAAGNPGVELRGGGTGGAVGSLPEVGAAADSGWLAADEGEAPGADAGGGGARFVIRCRNAALDGRAAAGAIAR